MPAGSLSRYESNTWKPASARNRHYHLLCFGYYIRCGFSDVGKGMRDYTEAKCATATTEGDQANSAP